MSVKQMRRVAWLRLQEMLGRDLEHFAPHGIPVTVPKGLDDALSYNLAKGRPYEDEEAQMVRRHLTPGTHVIELGGCLGIVSALIRNRIGPDATHVVVEANPGLIPVLTRNATHGNTAAKTRVMNVALDYSGRDTVSFDLGHNAHVGRVGGTGNDRGKGTMRITAPATTLAALAGHLPPGPFALICDVEGAELDLFAHEQADVLARISLMVLETHPKFYDGGIARQKQLLDRLAELGFVVAEERNDVLCLTRGG